MTRAWDFSELKSNSIWIGYHLVLLRKTVGKGGKREHGLASWYLVTIGGTFLFQITWDLHTSSVLWAVCLIGLAQGIYAFPPSSPIYILSFGMLVICFDATHTPRGHFGCQHQIIFQICWGGNCNWITVYPWIIQGLGALALVQLKSRDNFWLPQNLTTNNVPLTRSLTDSIIN